MLSYKHKEQNTMEKSQYIIRDNPDMNNTRGFYQRSLDMVAFYYLATLALGKGNPYNSEDQNIINFFEGKKDFPKTLHSQDIQKYLREICKKWKNLYQNSNAVAKITTFIKSHCKTDSYHKGNNIRPFDTMMSYYTNDKNHEYISVEKVFEDICSGNKELEVCENLDIFFKDLEDNTANFDPDFKSYLSKKRLEDESES